jgi:hypothetical protein
MGSSIILAGLGMAAVGFAGRHALRVMPQVSSLTLLQESRQAIRHVVPQVCSLNGRCPGIPKALCRRFGAYRLIFG